jgi:hypothetical protein
LLALLGAYHILYVSRIRVNKTYDTFYGQKQHNFDIVPKITIASNLQVYVATLFGLLQERIKGPLIM